jgi:hypothetical protein
MNAQGIFDLFETAISNRLKYPKIRLLATDGATVVLRRNGDKSRYPGAIAVTDDRPYGANSYFGRIESSGQLVQGRDFKSPVAVLLESLASNPAKTAAEYGKLTGHCCFCEAPLKDARSTAVGYGPICADHFGLPWGVDSEPFKLTPEDATAAVVEVPADADAQSIPSVPTPETLLTDPCTPFWAQSVIRTALDKDCVDAANVFAVLAKSFDARVKSLAGGIR